MGETDQKYTGRKKTAGQKAYKEENQMEAYQNTALSPEERAKDLLGRMTLKEKVGQLISVCTDSGSMSGRERNLP